MKFNWVIRNELAIGTAPQKQSDLKLLKEFKVTSILSLCSEDEALRPKNIEKDFLCKRVILPDHTYSREMNQKELKLALNVLEELKTKGTAYIHCKAAVERSPLVCIAWLIKNKGLSINQALNYLMQVNKGTCPSKENLDLLKDLN